jgi:hypothetical protein
MIRVSVPQLLSLLASAGLMANCHNLDSNLEVDVQGGRSNGSSGADQTGQVGFEGGSAGQGGAEGGGAGLPSYPSAGNSGESGGKQTGQVGFEGGSAGQGGTEGGGAGLLSYPSAGNSGESGGKGGANSMYMGGASGTRMQENAAGADSDLIGGATESALVPSCVKAIGNEPMPIEAPSSLAVSQLQWGTPHILYATQPTGNVMSLRWTLGNDPAADWQAWTCFDLVPHPERAAAANLSDNMPEVYVTTHAGGLFVRRFTLQPYGWVPWQPHPLPTYGSRAVDVAAVGLPSLILFLYVIDRDRVFVRHREGSSPGSAYLPWVEIDAPPGPRRITAAIRPDGRQQVFIADDAGALFTAIQTGADLDAGFGEFERLGDVSTPAFGEISCGYLTNGSPVVFGLSDGAVWSRSANVSGSENWILEAGDDVPRLATLAVGSWIDGKQPPAVYGTGVVGPSNLASQPRLWHHRVGSSVWKPIE